MFSGVNSLGSEIDAPSGGSYTVVPSRRPLLLPPEGRRESFAGQPASLVSHDSRISRVTTGKCLLTGVFAPFWPF